MAKKRSVGVTVFGIVAIIISVLHVLPCILILTTTYQIRLGDIILVISIALIGFAFGFSGIFLLRLKNWARILFMFQMVYLAVILIAFRPFCFLMWLMKSGIEDCLKSLFAWLVCLVLPCSIFIYFFTRPKVKEQFR